MMVATEDVDHREHFMMLLTLNAASLQFLLTDATESDRLELTDIPRIALDQLLLRGLVVDTSLLRGWSLDALHDFRNRADQAGCPCLVLRETEPITADSDDEATNEKTMTRLGLIARAASRLGCNALALRLRGFEGEEALNRTATFLRSVMERIDRMELNLLVEPGDGDLSDPCPLIQLIKKVGGFRIGTMPSFVRAIQTGDPESVLRQTAPYAGAVLASCGFENEAGKRTSQGRSRKKGGTVGEQSLSKEELNQIGTCVEALRRVGYGQVLAIDYLGSGVGLGAIEQARSAIVEVLQGA